jgi:hypothetical protein
VPPGSILHLPSALQERVVGEPAGDFVLWPTFLKRNAAWLLAQEVPLEMARGDGRAAETVLKTLKTESRLVVAVYRGGAISILEAAPAASKPGN